MKTGMLWFDDNDTDMAAKIEKGASRFREKYGIWPDLVYTNPNTKGVEEHPVAAPVLVENQTIALKVARSILPNHFWFGVEDKSG